MGRPHKLVKERDKEASKIKLIHAVGEIIRLEGYSGLGVNKVAKQAGLSKKLIYNYFKSFDGLIEAYIRTKDYWAHFSDCLKEKSNKEADYCDSDSLGDIFEGLMAYFYSEPEMQKIIHWQISESNPFLKSISNGRESLATDIFKMTDIQFKDTDINFRAVCALLLGGTYYTVLHAKVNGSTVCGLDINKDIDRRELVRTLKEIIRWAFEKATAS